ncbi:hypothetical protein DFH06DRAFT_1339417 [Mycena polygramma]|nr:hypothetical protein DFH06DRAFT_1339417 [Mycena polygramma]
MSLSLLPLDLLDDILFHVRIADLASICRASRVFRTQALNALYRDLLLTDSHSLTACFSLLDDPSLAERVQGFSVRCEDAGSFYGVLEETLAVLPNLRVLELFMGPADRSCQWILPINSCPFQLEAFYTDFNFTADVGMFIAKQPALTAMSVIWGSGRDYAGNLDFLGLRYLTKIFAPFTLIEALVPGRPIREVKTFRDSLEIDPYRIGCLTQSTCRIERLQIDVLFLRAIGPELLAATLPYLSCLTVVVNDDHKAPESEFMPWVLDFLGRYPPPLHCFNVRLDMRLPWQMIRYHHSSGSRLSVDQELEYFCLYTSHWGYAAKRVGKMWIEASPDEVTWVETHSAK